MVCQNPVHGLEDSRGAARTRTSKNSNRNNRGSLGNAELGSRCGSCNVGSVTMAVGAGKVFAECVEARKHATFEVGVVSGDAGVYDINTNTLAAIDWVVVFAVQSLTLLINAV